MEQKLSSRLRNIIDLLPIRPGMRILEIGCGPGAAAREVAKRLGTGKILAIDRSRSAIDKAIKTSKSEIDSKVLTYRVTAIEDFELQKGESPFDLAFAVRVGALDGRHPEIEQQALTKIAKALTKEGTLFIDQGKGIKEILLDRYR
jgi:cyclopropane fatty-acyl-phospholipid synthase-like methyltransferase